MVAARRPSPERIVMIGPFGMHPRMTMKARALPLAKALVRRGHTVTLLLPPWQNPEDAGHITTEEGVCVENAALPRRIPGWFHGELTRRLVSRAVALSPDVVHVFKPKAYAGLAHLALRRRYPVVVDADDWEGPGGWNEVGGYGPVLRRFFTWQERWGLVSASAITVASRALQTLAWSVGADPSGVVYMPNGPSSPSHEILPVTGGRPTVLLYTRFFEFSLDRLWRLMCLVRDEKQDVRFLVVGKGFQGEEARLLERADRAGWETHASEAAAIPSASAVPDGDLVYVGWGTPTNLPVCLGCASLAIYPFDDTLLNRTKCPVKLMDLLAAGVPVVADGVGQIAEVILHGRTGRLVRPGDDAAFVADVVALLDAPAQCRAMGEAAKADIALRFSWDRLADAALAAYRHALER